jgi:hypothetical protein
MLIRMLCDDNDDIGPSDMSIIGSSVRGLLSRLSSGVFCGFLAHAGTQEKITYSLLRALYRVSKLDNCLGPPDFRCLQYTSVGTKCL